MTLDAVVTTVDGQLIAKIAKEQSKERLPSRGQVYVEGTMNGYRFAKVLEPDGYWSHWFRFDREYMKEFDVRDGDVLRLEVTVSKNWPEPDVPKDFADGIAAASEKVRQKWHDITPMARWEWIRWVNSTNSLDTRAIRIEKSVSKLDGKHRRPCCFNLAACTDPELMKNGRLKDA